jgi:hypothetical protein
MDSCGRDPICRPSEPRFLSPNSSLTDHDCGGNVAPQWKLHYPNGAAFRKVGQKWNYWKFGRTAFHWTIDALTVQVNQLD